MFHEICICTTGQRHEMVIELLDDLSRCDGVEKCKVRIIINGLSGTIFYLENYLKKAKFPISVEFARPGLASARNYALATSISEIITFLDDDVNVERNFIESIENIFENNPNVVGTSPIIRDQYLDLLTTNLGRLKYYFIEKFFQGKITKSGLNYWIMHSEKSLMNRKVMWLPGCCMSYRTSSIINIKFPEELQYGPMGGYSLGEDIVFSNRILAMGDLYSNTKTIVEHKKAQSARNERELISEGIGRLLAFLCKEKPPTVLISRVVIRLFREICLQALKSILFWKKFDNLRLKSREIIYFVGELNSPKLVSRE